MLCKYMCILCRASQWTNIGYLHLITVILNYRWFEPQVRLMCSAQKTQGQMMEIPSLPPGSGHLNGLFVLQFVCAGECD